jgi:hypothetical protein
LLGSATVTGGTAVFSYSFANAGPMTVYATYSGDATDALSTSTNLTQTVLANTSVALVSGQNPSTVGTGSDLPSSQRDALDRNRNRAIPGWRIPLRHRDNFRRIGLFQRHLACARNSLDHRSL